MTAATISSTHGPFWRPSAPLRVAPSLRSHRDLAAALVAAICAFTLLLTATAGVSTIGLFGTETGVAAQTEPAQPFVGAETPMSPAFVGPNSPYAYDAMSGCCVAPGSIPGVRTPFGVADQAMDAASLAARADVEGGARIWRVGTTGRSNAADAQFWSLEHPSTPGFADRYGIPPENVLQTDSVESAVVPPGTPFVTRPAPGVGPNTGGGIEVVVPEGSVTMCGFSITGGC